MEPFARNWSDVPAEQVNALFARQLITGEKMMVARLDLKQGCVVPTHSHDNEQISMGLSGVIRLWLGADEETVVTLTAGDVLVIPGGVTHRAEVLEDFIGIDLFSPPRQDWLTGTDAYLRR